MKRNMRKILPSMLIAASMIVIMSVSAFAQLVPTNTEWNVSFAADNTMVSDFSTAEMDDKVYGLQPGDYTDIVLNLTNDNEATVDWYMTNDVITSLEDSNQGAAGGAAHHGGHPDLGCQPQYLGNCLNLVNHHLLSPGQLAQEPGVLHQAQVHRHLVRVAQPGGHRIHQGIVLPFFVFADLFLITKNSVAAVKIMFTASPI